jgi:hypothetical protein
MSDKRKNLMDRVASMLDEVEESLNGIVELHDVGGYRATPEELAAIDEAEQSGIATHEEVEAAFGKFRGA